MRKSTFLVAASVVAMASASGMAQTHISAAINAEYARAETRGVSADGFGGGGQALIAFDSPGLNLQISGGGASSSGGGISADSWLAGSDLFWRDAKGALGISVAHGSVGISGLSTALTGYGGFAEWYATKRLTLRFNGGGFSGDASGWYGSAGAEFYVAQNCGVYAEYDYLHPSSRYLDVIHTGSAGVEYAFSSVFPLSLRAGYDYMSTSGSSANGFSIALRYRIGLSGSLVNLDRTGPTSWSGLPSLMRTW